MQHKDITEIRQLNQQNEDEMEQSNQRADLEADYYKQDDSACSQFDHDKEISAINAIQLNYFRNSVSEMQLSEKSVESEKAVNQSIHCINCNDCNDCTENDLKQTGLRKEIGSLVTTTSCHSHRADQFSHCSEQYSHNSDIINTVRDANSQQSKKLDIVHDCQNACEQKFSILAELASQVCQQTEVSNQQDDNFIKAVNKQCDYVNKTDSQSVDKTNQLSDSQSDDIVFVSTSQYEDCQPSDGNAINQFRLLELENSNLKEQVSFFEKNSFEWLVS